jgi:hypothetical protein
LEIFLVKYPIHFLHILLSTWLQYTIQLLFPICNKDCLSSSFQQHVPRFLLSHTWKIRKTENYRPMSLISIDTWQIKYSYMLKKRVIHHNQVELITIMQGWLSILKRISNNIPYSMAKEENPYYHLNWYRKIIWCFHFNNS